MSSKSDFKILAIDDEKDILLLLKYNLEQEGYTRFNCINNFH